MADEPVGAAAAAASNQVGLGHYTPFFRELDLAIFNIFSFGDVVLLTRPPEEEEIKAPKLRPPELLFLLQVRFLFSLRKKS